MTIKRRLTLSNTLMIIIPIVLFVLFSTIMSFALVGVFGDWGGRSFDDNKFYSAKNELETLALNWDGGTDDLLEKVEDLQKQFGSEQISFSLYYNGEYVSGAAGDTPILEAALALEGSHILILDQTAIYMQTFENYHIFMDYNNYHLVDQMAYIPYIIVGICLLFFMVVIIFITNRVLTRIVVKSITVPLETLSNGVEQIRQGNLSFRLDYQGKDEFTPVCVAFNIMADRLQNMYEARQNDEDNRRELIAGISHDLRTPLTSIKAYLEGIEKGVAATPEQQKKYFLIIKSKTEALEHIISQLFLFSKLDVGEFPIDMRPIDISQDLADFVEDYGEEYKEKGLSIELEQKIHDVYVDADIVWLRSVFVNVLDNSAKYKTALQGNMHIVCNQVGNSVEIRMSDNGPGVDHDFLERLFDVFYRHDPSRNKMGSGLGLAITAKIIQRMGGEIRAESPSTGGLTMIIKLPIISRERVDRQ